MATVHVFISQGPFKSFEDMRHYIDKTYTEDGDGVDSEFIKDVQLSSYEPGCIEAIHKGQLMPLIELLQGASYLDQWERFIDKSIIADAAICVFEPNIVKRPRGCKLTYCGGFEYQP